MTPSDAPNAGLRDVPDVEMPVEPTAAVAVGRCTMSRVPRAGSQRRCRFSPGATDRCIVVTAMASREEAGAASAAATVAVAVATVVAAVVTAVAVVATAVEAVVVVAVDVVAAAAGTVPAAEGAIRRRAAGARPWEVK
jgi:hypothetical protein